MSLPAYSLPDVDLSELVPHDLALNLRFRRQMVEAGYESESLAHEIQEWCAADPLFFINTFCWILESRGAAEWQTDSRLGELRQIPFITRPYQTNAIRASIEHLGVRDIVVPKSRETGVTWIYIALAAWSFVFHEQTHIGFVSKDLLSADNSDDPDSLFSKFLFLLERLPIWLRPKIERNINNHTILNEDNQSSVAAFAATSDVARGGRKLWMLMDEFHAFKAGEDYGALASTQYVTHSRVFISTVSRDRGQSGAFYDIVMDDTHNGVKLVIDWKDDAAKRRGLYHSERKGQADSYSLVLDDAEFWSQHANGDGTYRHPTKPGQNYSFLIDGRTRSLYYDYQCARPGATDQYIAAELDRDFGGATSQIFSSTLATWALERVKKPLYRGDLNRHPDKANEWVFDPQAAEGLTWLWCELVEGKPPEGEYSAGADVSLGVGRSTSSYSCLSIFDKRSGEQAFEWRSNRLDPIQFAELAVWVCKWFWNAYLVPEKNGAGELFIKRAYHELRYANIHCSVRRDRRANTTSDVLGYRNHDGGVELLKNLEADVREKRVRINSVVALKEVSCYFFKNGRLVHAGAEGAEDGAEVGQGHGDAAIAVSCAVLGIKEWPASQVEEVKDVMPESCFAARRERYLAKQRQRGKLSYWNTR